MFDCRKWRLLRHHHLGRNILRSLVVPGQSPQPASWAIVQVHGIIPRGFDADHNHCECNTPSSLNAVTFSVGSHPELREIMLGLQTLLHT